MLVKAAYVEATETVYSDEAFVWYMLTLQV